MLEKSLSTINKILLKIKVWNLFKHKIKYIKKIIHFKWQMYITVLLRK